MPIGAEDVQNYIWCKISAAVKIITLHSPWSLIITSVHVFAHNLLHYSSLCASITFVGPSWRRTSNYTMMRFDSVKCHLSVHFNVTKWTFSQWKLCDIIVCSKVILTQSEHTRVNYRIKFKLTTFFVMFPEYCSQSLLCMWSGLYNILHRFAKNAVLWESLEWQQEGHICSLNSATCNQSLDTMVVTWFSYLDRMRTHRSIYDVISAVEIVISCSHTHQALQIEQLRYLWHLEALS